MLTAAEHTVEEVRSHHIGELAARSLDAGYDSLVLGSKTSQAY